MKTWYLLLMLIFINILTVWVASALKGSVPLIYLNIFYILDFIIQAALAVWIFIRIIRWFFAK
jgi:hypothetical protein